MAKSTAELNDLLDGHIDPKTRPNTQLCIVPEDHDQHGVKDENEPEEQVYGINDVPPWYISIALGLQHYITMFGGAVSIPYLIAPRLCISDGDPARGLLISTMFLVSGIATLLQTTFGSRLPIIQGPSLSFLIPTLAILSQPHFLCPSIQERANFTKEQTDEQWMTRMREVQGAIVVASVVEIIIGLTGIIGLLVKFITPLAIAPTITLIGLNLFEEAAKQSAEHWGIAALTMGLLIAFSQYMNKVELPTPRYSKIKGWHWKWFPFFTTFPVILTILLSWGLCAILTATEVFPSDSKARTDIRMKSLYEAKWFLLLYPGQWGWPTISAGAVIGVIAGVVASVIESVGDYFACAKLSKAPPPPLSAINRGIFFEGIGSILAGCFGTGSGLTSYSENIGAISITKVASRRVVQYSAVIMMIFGVLGKFGALFMAIPSAVVGGIFCISFGIITGVGISNLQFVNLNCSRNIFVIGFSIFMGLSVPKWLERNPEFIQTGSDIGDQILTILLKTSMFVGGFLGCLLDNTIPGSATNRGLIRWREDTLAANSDSEPASNCYDFPFGMKKIRQLTCFEYLPISPTFNNDKMKFRKQKEHEESTSYL